MACRIAGSDRFDTSARISAATFPGGVEVVFIATGRNFPDALVGAAVAAGFGAPILLVETTGLPPPIVTELTRLQPDTIVILGGEGAVGPGVAATLATYGTVVRIAGENRYATAAAISEYGFPDGTDTVFLATATGFVDALAGGPAAAAAGAPILLVAPDSVPAVVGEEIVRLGASQLILLGGPAAVSPDVEAALGAYGTVTRLAGNDRYATAAAISAYAFPAGAAGVFIAVGTAYPDALAGAAAAGHLGEPLLVVRGGAVPDVITNEIVRLGPSAITVLGGPSAVSLTVQGRLSNLI
jgi:putative cell wall-binding protein